jgi:hypothetical protein
VSLDWIERRDVTRERLIDLLTATFTASLNAARQLRE